MPFFRYEVQDKLGRSLRGVMSARDEAEVRRRLTSRGYTIVSVSSTDKRRPGRSAWGSVAPAAMGLFFRQLAALVRSGISPFAALADLGPRLSDGTLREAAASMCASADAGASLSSAMDRFGDLFPPHVVAAVRAGETGGFLEVVLNEVALEYEQQAAFRRALRLPLMLVVQAVAAMLIVQPVFPTLFPELNWAGYLRLVLLRNLPLAVALALIARWLLRRLAVKSALSMMDRWTLGMPVVGEFVRLRSQAAFLRTLRRLLAAGVAPIQSWETAVHVAPNAEIRRRLMDARDLMTEGIPLHRALSATGVFASDVEQMVATGVQSGQVVEMMDRVTEYMQRQLEEALERTRFWMLRLTYALYLMLAGLVLIVLVRGYFNAVLRFTEGWTDSP